MTTASPATSSPQRGTLDDFLAAEDLAPLPELTDRDETAIRRDAGRRLAWRFCTLRYHVAGVVTPLGDGRIRVVPAYELDDRLIGVILLHALDADRAGMRPLE